MRHIVTIVRERGSWYVIMFDDGSTVRFLESCMSNVFSELTKPEFVEFYHHVIDGVARDELPMSLAMWVNNTRDLAVNGGPGIYKYPTMTDADFERVTP